MIKLKNVSLSIDGREILNDVSLRIEKGTTSVILGPSGAGKSTILKAMLGLVGISSGSVDINGHNIYQMKHEELFQLRRKLAMVFQANALFDSLNVFDNAAYFLAYKSSLSKQQIKERVDEVLAFVNLDGTEDLYPDQLSGGMKKRLAIARALATKPDVILFDEPTNGLDPVNSKSILDLINRLKATGTTFVVVTHIIHDAIAIADKLTVINEGRLVASGGIKDILNSEDSFVKLFFYELFQEKALFQI